MAEETEPQASGFDEVDFERLVFDIDSSKKSLIKGEIPDFETPEKAVESYASERGVSPAEFRRRFAEQGFDVEEAIIEVGRSERSFAPYVAQAKRNREQVKKLYEQREGQKEVQKAQERVMRGVLDQASKGKRIATEVKELYLPGRVTDAGKDFVFSGPTPVQITDPSVSKSGVFNTNEFTQKERFLQMPQAEASALSRDLLGSQPKLATLVNRYSEAEGGWGGYVSERLKMNAEARGLQSNDQEYDAFMRDPSNRKAALREVALWKTAGLWSAPVLVSEDMLLGDNEADGAGALSDTKKALKYAFSPTVEIIGVSPGRRNSGIIARQASGMRTAFDVIDVPQIVASGVVRAVTENKTPEPKIMTPISWLTDERLRKNVLNSLGSKDNLFVAALETDFAQKDTKNAVIAGGAGFLGSIFFPDLLGPMGAISKAVGGVTDVKKANRIIGAITEMEKAAGAGESAAAISDGMRKVDSLEAQLFVVDKNLIRDINRETEAIALRLHLLGDEGSRAATHGEAGQRVTDLLPSGLVEVKVSAGPGSTDTFRLDNLKQRAPHLSPATRRSRSKTPEGQLIGRQDAYNLANREAEFDLIEQAIKAGNDQLLAPQLRVSLEDDIKDLNKAFGAAGNRGAAIRLDSSLGMVLSDPAAFKARKLDDLKANHAENIKRLSGRDDAAEAIKKADAALTTATDSLDEFVRKSQKWLAENGDEATIKLLSAVEEGKRAVRSSHQARLAASVILKQKVAKKFGIDAPTEYPRLLDNANKIPTLSSSGLIARSRMIKNGVDETSATYVAALLDARAKNYQRRLGRDPAEYWERTFKGAERADAPDAPRRAPDAPDAPDLSDAADEALDAAEAADAESFDIAKAADESVDAAEEAVDEAVDAADADSPDLVKPEDFPSPESMDAPPRDLERATEIKDRIYDSMSKEQKVAANERALLLLRRPYLKRRFKSLPDSNLDNDFSGSAGRLALLSGTGDTIAEAKKNARTVLELMELMEAGASSAAARTIARRIRSLIPEDAKVILVNKGSPPTPPVPGSPPGTPPTPSTAINPKILAEANKKFSGSVDWGAYYSDTDKVMVFKLDSGATESLIMHEALHAATLDATLSVRRGEASPQVKKAYDELEELTDQVRTQVNKRFAALNKKYKTASASSAEARELETLRFLRKKQALGTGKKGKAAAYAAVDEMITYGFTDPDTIKFLRNTTVKTSKGTVRDAFSQFVQLVRRLLVPDTAPAGEITAFEELIKRSDAFFDAIESERVADRASQARQAERVKRINSIQQEIVEASERGEDVTELRRELIEIVEDFSEEMKTSADRPDALPGAPASAADRAAISKRTMNRAFFGEDGRPAVPRAGAGTAGEMAKNLAKSTDDPVLREVFEIVAERAPSDIEVKFMSRSRFDNAVRGIRDDESVIGGFFSSSFTGPTGKRYEELRDEWLRAQSSGDPRAEKRAFDKLNRGIRKRFIGVREDDVDELILAHEMLHATVGVRLRKSFKRGTEESKFFTRMVESVVSQVGDDAPARISRIAEILSDLEPAAAADELVTYGLTDPQFRSFLKSTRAVDGGKATLYDRFVSGLRKVLGLNKSQSSALDQLLSQVDEVLLAEETGSPTAYRYRPSPRGPDALPAAPTRPAPVPAPELQFLEDSRALLKGFEGEDLDTVIGATTRILVRDLPEDSVEALVAFIQSRVDRAGGKIDIGRRGSVLTGSPEDLRLADEVLSESLGKFIRDNKLDADADGLKPIFDALRDDMAQAYRTAENIGTDIPKEIADVFRPLVRNLPADEDPLPDIVKVIQKQLKDLRNEKLTDIARKGSPFLRRVIEEANRTGSSLSLNELNSKLPSGGETIKADKLIFETDKPIFPDLIPDQKKVGGKYRYTAEKLRELQQIYDESPAAVDSLLMSEPYATRILQDRKYKPKFTESFYEFSRSAPKSAGELAKDRAKLVRMFGEDTADSFIRKRDIGYARVLDKVKPLIMIAGHTLLGADEFKDLGNISPVVRNKLLAGTRRVEQSVGDSVRLSSEFISAKSADDQKDALEQLISYLSGGLASFRRGGRPALSSGTNKFADLRREVNTYIENQAGQGGLRNLQVFADLVRTRKVGDRFVAAGGGSELVRGFKAEPRTEDALREVNKLFRSGDAGDSMQVFTDYATTMLPTGEKTTIGPLGGQVFEAFLYHMGVTGRRSGFKDGVPQYVYANEDAREGVSDFLNEVLNASRGSKRDTVFGDHSNRSAVARLSVILGSNGTATRVRQDWANYGLYIDGDTMRAYADWSAGLAIPTEMIPKVEQVARTFGMNAEFFKDSVLSSNFFIPRAARDRLSDSLARGLVKREDFIGADRPFLETAWNVYNRFMKKSMVRGVYVVKQRYFFMNTYDHFNQLAIEVGFRAALASTTRLMATNFTVLPGMNVVMAAARAGDPSAPEKMRRVLQKGGDKAANVVSQLVANSKWRVEVNDILDGREGVVNLGGNLYSYPQLRSIAVEEGVFASFDVSELGKTLKEAQKAQNQFFSESVGGRIQQGFEWWSKHTDDTAEAWSERERIGAMVTLIEMGAEPRVAAQSSVRALYDYAGSMGEGDRRVWVNVLFPFWAFQKNANRQFVNNLFSPAGVYRMSVLRRGQARTADAATELLYECIVDEFGVSESSLNEEDRQNWMTFKQQILTGLTPGAAPGDFSSLSPSARELITEGYNPGLTRDKWRSIEELPEEVQEFIQYGYAGRDGEGVMPAEVKRQIRAIVAGQVSEGGIALLDGQIYRGFGTRLEDGQLKTSEFAEAFKDSPFLKRVSMSAVRRPDPAGRRGYLRDRLGIAVPFVPSDEVKLLYRLSEQITPDRAYMEVYLPESSVEAAMRQVSARAAVVLLLANGLYEGVSGAGRIAAGAAGVEVDPSSAEGYPYGAAFTENMRQMVDIERAPILNQLFFPLLMDDVTGAPIRLSPKLANLIQTSHANIDLITIPAKSDLMQAVEDGQITTAQAGALITSGEVGEVYKDILDADGTPGAAARDMIMSTYGPNHPMLTPTLAQKIVDVSAALEMDPMHLANAIRAESRFDHQAANSKSSARGLIQFMDKTARDTLGTTNEALLAMTPEEQMDYVYKYLSPYKGRLGNSEDVQMAIFYPNAIGKSDDFDILDDFHRVSYRLGRRDGMSETRAKKYADGMWVKYKEGNPGIRTRGDYLRVLGMKKQGSAVRYEFSEPIPDPEKPLPIRQRMDFTEDRYYMFPGVWQAAFIASGLNELNRLLIAETPTVKTPLERAGVGGSSFTIDVNGRLEEIPYPTTRAGMIIWAKTLLGVQTSEISAKAAARADEPRRKMETTRPPR